MNFLHARTFALLALGALATAFSQDAATPARSAGHSQEFRQNFNFSNTDLRSAFRALSATGRVDIVVSPSVNGTVASLQLNDKSWQEALTVLCQMYNLKYTVENNYLYVQTMAEYNKNSVENASAMQQNGSLAPLMRDVIKLRNAKAKDLMESVKGLLSPRGKVNFIERNNALLVFDTRQNLLEVRSAIHELDVETYQVNIQSELIEVDADALQEMGVDWQFGQGATDLSSLLNTPGHIPGPNGNFNVVGTSNPGGIVSSANSTTGSSSTSSGSGTSGGSGVGGVSAATSQFAFGLLNSHLAVAIADLLSNSHGEVLAKPQITTIDNTEASIFMGEEVPVKVLDVNGRQAVQLEDAGTSLTVTPHVTGDGRILLDLNPEKNSFRVDPTAGVILQKQSAKTTVLVNDGETVVIAGLTTKQETEAESGIPLLKDIPILGWLFKHKSTSTTKSDLIVFVTPHIVRSSNGGSKVSFSAPSGDANLPEEGVYGDQAPTPSMDKSGSGSASAPTPAPASTPSAAPANSEGPNSTGGMH